MRITARFGSAASCRLILTPVKPPRRLSIPGCIGCGAMRQYESCVGACREHRLELVSGGDYDQLTAATAACRVRIEGLWAVVGELARTEAGPASGRSRTRRFGNRRVQRCGVSGPHRGPRNELLSPAETVIVWRCQDCGGVDAPRQCIDVCIGVRPTGWMRPRMSPSGRGPPSIARLSGRWPGCFAGWRSPRRVTGSGSGAGVPFNRKRGSLSGQGNYAALRTRWSSLPYLPPPPPPPPPPPGSCPGRAVR